MKNTVSSILVLAASLSLAACEKTREQFDFSKKPPDEFAVVKRAPLEMPPDFELRAPKPGAPRPQEQATDQVARQVILGEDAQKAIAREAGVTQGEAVLLQKKRRCQRIPRHPLAGGPGNRRDYRGRHARHRQAAKDGRPETQGSASPSRRSGGRSQSHQAKQGAGQARHRRENAREGRRLGDFPSFRPRRSIQNSLYLGA